MVTSSRIALIVVMVGLLTLCAAQQHADGNENAQYMYVSPMPYTMPLSTPFIMAIPPTPIVSAQQICASHTGWQWRSEGVAMCFRSGNVPCPTGYPWMRRATEHYTVCVSQENFSRLF